MNTAARTTAGLFGPWVPGVREAERIAQLQALCALTAAYCGSGHELVGELRKAEVDEAAAANALELLDRLPSLTRRHLISTFASIMQPRRGWAR